MIDLPVVMTTYFEPGLPGLDRAKNALETASSWAAHGGIERIIAADDASDHVNHSYFSDGLDALFGNGALTLRSTRPRGVGSSLNRGMRQAFETADICLYAVDDWRLTADFDFSPWVDILNTEEDLGCIRLGPPHPNLRGTVRHLSDRPDGTHRPWLLNLEPYGYAVAQRPALWHRRFFDTMGWWREDCSAIACERALSEEWTARLLSFDRSYTPGIALALPHPWHHTNPSELSALDPKERNNNAR